MKLILIAAALNGTVALTGLLSYYCDGMFFVQQALRHRGGKRVMPLIVHGGIWGDLLWLNPLLAALVYECGDEWTNRQWLVAVSASFAASLAMHALYKKNPDPNCLAWRGRLTKAGRVHVLYMTFAFAILGLFYFATPHPAHGLLAAASIIVCFHIFVGMQMIANLLSPPWWNKTVRQDPQGVTTTLVVWALVGWRWHALSS